MKLEERFYKCRENVGYVQSVAGLSILERKVGNMYQAFESILQGVSVCLLIASAIIILINFSCYERVKQSSQNVDPAFMFIRYVSELGGGLVIPILLTILSYGGWQWGEQCGKRHRENQREAHRIENDRKEVYRENLSLKAENYTLNQRLEDLESVLMNNNKSEIELQSSSSLERQEYLEHWQGYLSTMDNNK